MYLLIYDEPRDPVVESLDTNRHRLNSPLVMLTPDDILHKATIFDRIEDGVPYINWSFDNLNHIKNTDDVMLINRMPFIPDRIFDDFHADDKEYAKAEFNAYMIFALNAFERKLTEPGFHGLAGGQLPLPVQWKKVHDSFLDSSSLELKIPDYYLGAAKYCPYSENRKDIIYSATYNFRHWRPGPRPLDQSVFAFRRPKGIPTFVFVANDRCLTTNINGGDVSWQIKDKLEQASIAIAEEFGSRLAEILFFVDENDITFGVLDIHPVVTAKSNDFTQTLINGIQSYFEAN